MVYVGLTFYVSRISDMISEFAQRVVERGPTPRNGNKTDNAHPPIHPTKYTNNLQVT